MANDLKKKPLQKVQRRDGLPKVCSVEEWLDLHRKQDQQPRLGGIGWANDSLVVVLRLHGRVHALPFDRFTQTGRIRDMLTDTDRAKYDDLWQRAMAGEFNAWADRKRKEIGNVFGF